MLLLVLVLVLVLVLRDVDKGDTIPNKGAKVGK